MAAGGDALEGQSVMSTLVAPVQLGFTHQQRVTEETGLESHSLPLGPRQQHESGQRQQMHGRELDHVEPHNRSLGLYEPVDVVGGHRHL